MKIAVIQLKSSQHKSENIAKALSFIDQAARQKARFVLLPEVFTFRGVIRPEKGESLTKAAFIDRVADDLSGETINQLRAAAKEHRVFVLAGSIYERSADPQRAYNTSVLISPNGQILKSYRKIHLFNAIIGDKRYAESDYFLAGEELQSARVEEFSVGLSVCYDLRFPELYREYRRQGADVFCVPSAFTRVTGEAHWKTLICSRAIENLCYVLAPNQVGEDNLGRRCYGHSLIVDPWGSVLAEASGDQEEIIYADISREAIEKFRATLGQT